MKIILIDKKYNIIIFILFLIIYGILTIIIKPLKKKIINIYRNQHETIIRTLIYTLGHFLIAALCVMYFTGTDFITGLTDALVEPILNGVRYYILDRLWVNKTKKYS